MSCGVISRRLVTRPDRLEGHRPVLAAALAPQDQHPAAELPSDPGGEPAEALLDGLLVEVDLAGGVGDDQVPAGQELQHSPGAGAWPAGGDAADVGLADRGGGTGPGQHDPQAPRGKAAGLLVPSLGPGVLPELGQQGLRGRGQRWQLVQRPDSDAAPVAAGIEQHGLPRDGQVRRDRRCRRPPGGGPGPGLVLRGDIAEHPVPHREAGGEFPAEPQLGRPGPAGA
jgi:hypothetical protein